MTDPMATALNEGREEEILREEDQRHQLEMDLLQAGKIVHFGLKHMIDVALEAVLSQFTEFEQGKLKASLPSAEEIYDVIVMQPSWIDQKKTVLSYVQDRLHFDVVNTRTNCQKKIADKVSKLDMVKLMEIVKP